MIFPAHCKHVGYAASRPVGDRVYFLSRFLIRETPSGYEIVAIEPDPDETGMMRSIKSEHLLATSDEIAVYPEKVNLFNRGDIILRALSTGKRCTIFTGDDEHMTFVLDPDRHALVTLQVYDITPPRPYLSETIKALNETGVFGELEITLSHNIRDIREIGADVYPCRAAGFNRTLDSDQLSGNERVAGCLTSKQVLAECYMDEFSVSDICPANTVSKEPFIARCCRNERTGLVEIEGRFGGIVHWGASPREITEMVWRIIAQWRAHHADSSR
jgi:hypothetical protein